MAAHAASFVDSAANPLCTRVTERREKKGGPNGRGRRGHGELSVDKKERQPAPDVVSWSSSFTSSNPGKGKWLPCPRCFEHFLPSQCGAHHEHLEFARIRSRHTTSSYTSLIGVCSIPRQWQGNIYGSHTCCEARRVTGTAKEKLLYSASEDSRQSPNI